jgi:hypothetical protein
MAREPVTIRPEKRFVETWRGAAVIQEMVLATQGGGVAVRIGRRKRQNRGRISFYEIQLVNGNLIPLDDEGSSYECRPFASCREATRTIRE